MESFQDSTERCACKTSGNLTNMLLLAFHTQPCFAKVFLTALPRVYRERLMDERNNVAESCVRNLHIEIPALLDDFQNTTETAYTGWPDRLYVIDRAGKVAFKSAPGPFGFHTKTTLKPP